MDAWLNGVRNGHAFVSSGPLVELSIDGKIPGETVMLPADGGEIIVQARVRSITPLQTVELIRNGSVVEEIPLSDVSGQVYDKPRLVRRRTSRPQPT